MLGCSAQSGVSGKLVRAQRDRMAALSISPPALVVTSTSAFVVIRVSGCVGSARPPDSTPTCGGVRLSVVIEYSPTCWVLALCCPTFEFWVWFAKRRVVAFGPTDR